MSNMNNSMGNTTETFDPADIEKNKTIAGITYLIFFLPLLACPESRYARFHANQSLILFILSIVGSIVFNLIPYIGWILYPFFALGVFVLFIIGLLNGLGGKAKELPLIGGLRLLK